MKIRSLFTGLLFAGALAIPVLSSAQTKPKKLKARVAVVDVDRCVGDTEDGLRAKAALAKAKLRRDSMLYAMEERIKMMEDDLKGMMEAHQKSGAATPNPKMQELALTYQKALSEYQVATKNAQNDLTSYEDQLFLPIEKKVKGIFARIAEEQGFDLIVDRRSMPISLKPELDLTEQVIREYNWGKPGAAPAAPASASAKKP
jgi:Skp family chaperone for outer membrane proteins